MTRTNLPSASQSLRSRRTQFNREQIFRFLGKISRDPNPTQSYLDSSFGYCNELVLPEKSRSFVKKPSLDTLLLTSFSSKTSIADFSLVKVVGIGCFSKVWLAKWINEGNRPVVVKIVNKKNAQKLGELSHLHSELTLLGSLRHPSIVQLLTSFHDEENFYFVMEYLAGGEIYQVVRKNLKNHLPSILYYMSEICMALQFLHSNGIAHRDLKPENVLIAADGHAKLADFGLAKKLGKARTTTICGTPGYLAPEQVRRQEYGIEVDLWAYGVLLFELLAGYNPFYDISPRRMYENIVGLVINWPPFISKHSRSFLKRLLVLNPENRMPAKYFLSHQLFQEVCCENFCNAPPPFVPKLKHDFDSQYFYEYPSSTEIDKQMEERMERLREAKALIANKIY